CIACNIPMFFSIQVIIFHEKVHEMTMFPWGCANYSGVCRSHCLPTELMFGPYGCEKGFVCCVSKI
uniref:Beta-defensin n=1 Tax=Denticeps clupeoides TaxID=299321 RepID=A0AAY4C9K7_9TELE